MIKWIDRLWPKPKKDDTTPDTPPTDDSRVPLLRVYAILKSIQFRKLLPVFVSIPAIVFLAISGFIAWLMVLAKFAVGIFNMW